MIRTLSDPYLAQNAGRRYPLADDAPAIDNSSDADAALLDFACTVPNVPAGRFPSATLTAISHDAAGKTLTVSVFTSDGVPAHNAPVCTLTFHVPSTIAESAPFTATAENNGVSARLVVSASVLTAGESPALSIPFSRTTTVADALKVDSLTAVGSIGDEDDTFTSTADGPNATLSGEIVLADGRNAESRLSENRISVDIYKGGGIGERCQSVTSGQQCGNVLFTINGERPGSDGNILLVGDSGILVTPDPDNHAIEIKIGGTADGGLSAACDTLCGGN